jgi:hypothetical protein
MLATARPIAKRCLTAALLCSLAGLAQADVPAAMDRAPTSTEVAIAIKNVGQFDTRLKAMTGSLGVDNAELGPVGQLISLPGLNKDGSAAILLSYKARGDANAPDKADAGSNPSRPDMIAVLPVADFAGFVKGLGTEEKGKITLKDEFGGRVYYIKDIGGGFAAMAQSAEELAAFDGKPGNKAAHEKILGKVGSQINDASEAILIANMDLLRPKMEAGLAQMAEQTQAMAQMAGPQGEQLQGQLKMFQAAGEAFVKDASVGIIGLGLSDTGMSMDFGAQFKEGTESAKLFAAPGNSAAILSHLPAQPFYFAMAGDLSSAGIKQLFRKAVDMQKAGLPKDAKMDDGTLAMIVRNIDTLNNFGMVMGASPGGLMGGLFANTTYFAGTSKPQDFLASQKATIESMNGVALNGITYKTTYTTNAVTVEDAKVDQWAMQMQVDPNNPAAMQIQQMQSMMFGMGGLSGYNAATDSGVVAVMSQNTPLLTAAIKAAKDGKGLGEDALLKDAQKNLPEGRSFEGYIGVKALLDTASGFMAMMGGGTAYQTPAQVAPIAMGGTTNDGGLRMKLFVPASTIKTIGDFAKSFEGMGEADGGEAAPEAQEKGKAPRF